MATGYVHSLKERNYDVKRWLKEDLVRAMGLMIEFRDEGNLTEEEILKRFQEKEAKPTEGYHERALREAIEKFDRFVVLSKKEQRAQYTKARAESRKQYDERVKTNRAEALKYKEALAEIERIQKLEPPLKDPVVEGTLKFAHQQLTESYNHDFGSPTYREEILNQTFEAWLGARVKTLEHMVQYHTEQFHKEVQKKESKFEMYRNFVNFINQAFETKTKKKN